WLLVLQLEALDAELLAHFVDLPLDVGVLVVAGLLRLGEEQVVQDQVLHELPLPIGRREIGARGSRQAIDLAQHLGAGELLAGVGRDHLGRVGGRQGSRLGGGFGRGGRGAGLLLGLLTARNQQHGTTGRDHVTGAHSARTHSQRRAGSQFSTGAEAVDARSWRRRASASATPAETPDVSTATSRRDAVRLGTNSWWSSSTIAQPPPRRMAVRTSGSPTRPSSRSARTSSTPSTSYSTTCALLRIIACTRSRCSGGAQGSRACRIGSRKLPVSSPENQPVENVEMRSAQATTASQARKRGLGLGKLVDGLVDERQQFLAEL